MTVQHRRLIELSDIAAIELRCKACGTTLGFRLGQLPDIRKLASCPNCRREWFADKDSLAEQFEDAMAAVAKLRDSIQDREQRPEGFSLAVEVADDPRESHR